MTRSPGLDRGSLDAEVPAGGAVQDRQAARSRMPRTASANRSSVAGRAGRCARPAPCARDARSRGRVPRARGRRATAPRAPRAPSTCGALRRADCGPGGADSWHDAPCICAPRRLTRRRRSARRGSGRAGFRGECRVDPGAVDAVPLQVGRGDVVADEPPERHRKCAVIAVFECALGARVRPRHGRRCRSVAGVGERRAHLVVGHVGELLIACREVGGQVIGALQRGEQRAP
jgi:hypothetical protein